MLIPPFSPVCRALVIEDQDLYLEMLMNVLQSTLCSIGPCLVEGALTYEQALDVLHQNEFDLVVIDPGLPGFSVSSRQDRLTIVKHIVEASSDAIHIVVTGLDCDNEARTFQQYGIAAYVAKTGFNRNVLGDILNEISKGAFPIHFSRTTIRPPYFQYSELQPSEQEIIELMLNRPEGSKKKNVYERLAMRDDVDVESVEKRYKRARAKVLKNGLALPKSL